MKRLTLRDIAARAGVHYSTVSLALRNHPSIPAATRKRIQTLAQEMGYRPDPVLVRLAAYRQAKKPVSYRSTLAIITERRSVDSWRSHRIGQLHYEGIAERAHELGYEIDAFCLNSSTLSSQRLSKILISRDISGILVAPLAHSHGHMSFDWAPFSAVTLGFSLTNPPLHRVAIYHYSSVRKLIRNLRRLGYRRMAFCFHSDDDERLERAWTAAMLIERLRRPNEELLYYDTKHFTQSSFIKFLTTHRPSVVAGTRPDLLGHISKAGFSVPEEMGFVNMTVPVPDGTIAGMYEDSKEIGRVATDLLVSLIQRNERGIPAQPHIVLVDCLWIEGRTIRCLNDSTS